MEKKKALRSAAVCKPKGNGINDGFVRKELSRLRFSCGGQGLCRSLLAAFI